MAEPVWIERTFLLELYKDIVAASGGTFGVRDEGLLESALARPLNRQAYEGVADLLELAATYAVGISSNHPFIDGNKRVAFMAMAQFLNDNGLDLVANQEDATTTMLAVARGDLTISQLTDWLRTRIAPARD